MSQLPVVSARDLLAALRRRARPTREGRGCTRSRSRWPAPATYPVAHGRTRSARHHRSRHLGPVGRRARDLLALGTPTAVAGRTAATGLKASALPTGVGPMSSSSAPPATAARSASTVPTAPSPERPTSATHAATPQSSGAATVTQPPPTRAPAQVVSPASQTNAWCITTAPNGCATPQSGGGGTVSVTTTSPPATSGGLPWFVKADECLRGMGC